MHDDDFADALVGRLGRDTIAVQQADRHGLVWLSRGELFVEGGCLRFRTAGFDGNPAGVYAIPQQVLNAVLLGPGTSVTHDAFRLLAIHGVAMLAVGEGAVRIYTAPPLIPDRSDLARRQARLWADDGTRLEIARRMYGIRYGKPIPPMRSLDEMRGLEGARMRESYRLAAARWHIPWNGRRYDRSDPDRTDTANQALNHAATAVYAAASVAVYCAGAIPQLGFIHEDSGDSFCLDIADLYRVSDTIEIAFAAVSKQARQPDQPLDRIVRRLVSDRVRTAGLVGKMIDSVKEILS